MEKIRVAINGFGRIGRILTRLNLQRDIFDLVAINDINDDIENLKYLLKYDSIYGKLHERLEVLGPTALQVGEQIAEVYHVKNIGDIPWYENNIDIIIDASGDAENHQRLSAHENKFQHYILTSEHKDIKTIVCDINEDPSILKSSKYICASTCDAIALSPIIKAICAKYTFDYGSIVTLHPWLSYQRLMDSTYIEGLDKKDAYGLARAAGTSLIPKSTSVVKATAKLLPDYVGKIESFSYRVPTSSVSTAVINLRLNEVVSQNDIENVLNIFQVQQRFKTLSLEYENTVSIDHLGSNYSSVVDMRWNKIAENNIQLTYWYDNEAGYCSKLLDLIEYISCCKKHTMLREDIKEEVLCTV
ncbi:MAG: hypothetical protein NXI01_08050 [Gammaproteobacteria bacterium]|nr:hypothetical protein [Gammaproteobacteria bacterium]